LKEEESCKQNFSVNSIDLESPKLNLETGKLARMADSSLLLTQGDNRLLVTCCFAKESKPNQDFFPLTVDFEEKMSSVGLIPGGYNKREGKPTIKSILASRLIDRPIRPLFPEGFFNEVQIIVSVLSSDKSTPLDVLALCGVSAVLEISSLPVLDTIGALRVGLIDQKFVINPSYEELEKSSLDLVIAGTEKNILMIEANSSFVSEEIIVKACRFAQKIIKEQIEKIRKFGILNNSQLKKIKFQKEPEDQAIYTLVSKNLEKSFKAIVQKKIKNKKQRDQEFEETSNSFLDSHFTEKQKEAKTLQEQKTLESEKSKAEEYISKLRKKILRESILKNGVRIDGRSCEEIREISCEVGLLPRAHGSGLFTRGGTQVLSSVTLGSEADSRPVEGSSDLRYFHDYNFPPFSVGETRPLRSPGRREIGHGSLAEKALIPTLPSKEAFPYVIRVVSDALSSNGSTSMGSTCGSTIALMDAGVPIKEPISGIAMGLILEEAKFAVLSDIQGIEDFLGDMDFKVAGSRTGITALQLDVKVKSGIPVDLLEIALQQAHVGRIYILEKMISIIKEPRAKISKYAPLIYNYQVDPSEISSLIGSGGKNIKELIERTGVKEINISQEGIVTIVGEEQSVNQALERIKFSTVKIIPGKEYPGEIIKKTQDLIVASVHGKDALFKMFNPHKFANYKVGEKVRVLVRDFSRGRIYVSRITKPEEEKAPES